MAWHPKRKSTGVVWNTEYCASADLSERLQVLANEKWLVKYVFWDGVAAGMMTIVSMQSAMYAKAAKRAKGDDDDDL